ncbi:MAG: glycosyltransferase family 2 protein [candidate division NC10 bacterium]|nr:glycosyltransferase family 2 protein [candidate division NC10 bacterium]
MTGQVLLSTYNGQAYLRPLMESVLAQDCQHLEVLVRDDGSNDDTVNLLREYAAANPNVQVIVGDQVGVAQSYFELLQRSSAAADFLMLCDQDDVWRRDKVSRAVGCLARGGPETPALYCSRVAIVDEDLKLLGYSDLPRKGLSFRNALVQNVAMGCTITVNQAARRLLLRETPRHVCMHDWWFYLVVSAFGHLVYDEDPAILYRRHAGNVFGIPLGTVETWRLKLHRFRRYGKLNPVVRQAEEFNRIYGASLPEDHRLVLERFLESRRRLSHRLRYSVCCDVYRQSTRDQLLLKFLLLVNRMPC